MIPSRLKNIDVKHQSVIRSQGLEVKLLPRPWHVSEVFTCHFIRMALFVKEYEPARPVDVCLFRANGIVLRPQMPADAIE
jgi:hypothetical protein